MGSELNTDSMWSVFSPGVGRAYLWVMQQVHGCEVLVAPGRVPLLSRLPALRLLHHLHHPLQLVLLLLLAAPGPLVRAREGVQHHSVKRGAQRDATGAGMTYACVLTSV